MSKPPTGDLELDQDLAFQRREWIVQRVGLWALAIFVAAAAAGLFGGGPVSHARAGDARAVSVAYERFVRVGAPMRLSIQLPPPPGGASGEREIHFNRDYFDSLRIERLSPEPTQVVVSGDEVVLSFPASAGTEAVTLDAEPLSLGPQAARVSTGGGSPAMFTQFAFF